MNRRITPSARPSRCPEAGAPNTRINPSLRKDPLPSSFDHLVGSDKHRHGNGESNGSRSSKIHSEGECVGLNNREFADLRSLEDSPDIEADLTVASNEARAIAHQPACGDELTREIH